MDFGMKLAQHDHSYHLFEFVSECAHEFGLDDVQSLIEFSNACRAPSYFLIPFHTLIRIGAIPSMSSNSIVDYLVSIGVDKEYILSDDYPCNASIRLSWMGVMQCLKMSKQKKIIKHVKLIYVAYEYYLKHLQLRRAIELLNDTESQLEQYEMVMREQVHPVGRGFLANSS